MIKRRQFVSGIAVSVAAKLGASVSQQVMAETGVPASADPLSYPPGKTGLRGSHPGSFEVAHSLALGRQGRSVPTSYTDDSYDLIVVGAGISGLAAAYFWQQQHGVGSRILLLDNHDDLGGHAKRNEFTVEGRHLIGYGGSQSIESPKHYSSVARGLLSSLGIEPDRFYRYYDQDFARRHGLTSHWFFDAAHYGRDVLTVNPLGAGWLGVPAPEQLTTVVADMPLAEASKAALLRLLTDQRDWLAGMSVPEKLDYLRSKSYERYLLEDLGMPMDVALLLRQRAHGLWAVGYDALSAKAAAQAGEPGTTTLGLEDALWGDEDDEPYIFHFPDGNASIARLLLQALIPKTVPTKPPGHKLSMEEVVSTRFDYSAMDVAGQPVRLRLSATAVSVHHRNTDKPEQGVDVGYVQGGTAYRVHGRQVIMACYNAIIPQLCEELPKVQAEAMAYPEKAPLVYANIALKNWRAFKRAGLYHFHAVQDFWVYGALDFPVSMPGYSFSSNPNEPIILHMVHTPTDPGKPAREQYRNGRHQLMALMFDDYERALKQQLEAMLGPNGFVFEDDVAAITINRWPHGYAYEYIDLWDPPEWGPEQGPHILARRPFGRIAIANSDSSAYAYVNGAIDAAWRAVTELTS